MMKKILLLIVFQNLVFGQNLSNNDEWIRCLTDELEEQLFYLDPDFVFLRDKKILEAENLIKNLNYDDSLKSEIIVIPVIFHVLYFSDEDNISSDMIGANFDQINLDFQNLNTDGDKIPSSPNPVQDFNGDGKIDDIDYNDFDAGIDYSFAGVRGAHRIKFVGALGEENGIDLNEGITIRRYKIDQATVSNLFEARSLAANTLTDSGFPNGTQQGYLNIYVAPLSSILGQATLGGIESVVLNRSVGSVEKPSDSIFNYNLGRTLTHELGHNLTYLHTFNAQACDQVLHSDIPSQIQSNGQANLFEWPVGSGNFWGRDANNSCIDSHQKGDQFMNYMDYSTDRNLLMFSKEQAIKGYTWASIQDWAKKPTIQILNYDANYGQFVNDNFYVINSNNLEISIENLSLSNSTGNYFISIGSSVNDNDILNKKIISSNNTILNNLNLENFSKYYVNIFFENSSGTTYNISSIYFYFLESFLGDFNKDSKIDFEDFKVFTGNFSEMDFYPFLGEAPYLIPLGDELTNFNDLNAFEIMWNWSINNYNNDIPILDNYGLSPNMSLLNNKLNTKFYDASAVQLFIEYNPLNVSLDFITEANDNKFILDSSDEFNGRFIIEAGSITPEINNFIEFNFILESKRNVNDVLKLSYKSYNSSDQLIAQGVQNISILPSDFNLSQSYPNPFSEGVTTIRFDLPSSEQVSLIIIDIKGRVVRTLIDKEQRFGSQAVSWDAKNDNGDKVSSGVYFYQIKSENFNDIGKLVFVK